VQYSTDSGVKTLTQDEVLRRCYSCRLLGFIRKSFPAFLHIK
jgi:hypothetical protein